ncbi:hypothetical protein RND81_01G027200 [Saponaria officinalis]|uniref:Uncharacterized protein n=1 Tax=Saponaria officinalis TaxID=3572 RepID=A0AAW1N8F0_SAPOF
MHNPTSNSSNEENISFVPTAPHDIDTPSLHDNQPIDSVPSSPENGESVRDLMTEGDNHDLVSRTTLVGHPTRIRRPPGYLEDYVCGVVAKDALHSQLHEAAPGKPYPIANQISYDQLSYLHKAFLTSVISMNEPKSYNDAVHDPNWAEAMSKEIQALEENKTWKSG